MNEASLAAQDLARRLIALESAQEPGSDTGDSPALRAVDKLRFPLSKLAGADGFRFLLTRALTLAKAYSPSLTQIHVESNGSLQRAMDTPVSEASNGAADGETALLVELIGLLIAFIGEALTLQLLRVAWPDAKLKDASMDQKEILQ